MTRLIVFCGLSFGLSVGLVPFLRRLAERRDWLVATPVPDRWHRRRVPKVGGLAMFVALLPLTLASTAGTDLSALLALSTLMFGVGVLDDIRPIQPTTKIAAQMVAALLFLWLVPAVRLTGVRLLDVALSFAWILGITNAFNLLDNIDGLAGGLAVIACIFTIGLAGSSTTGIAIGLAAMAGAASGFLVYNWHRASIFMGDSGSHLLGAFAAGATLLSMPRAGHAREVELFAAFVLLLFVPIADLVLVTVTRILAGRSPLQGGIDHLSHRLVARGLGDRDAVLALYGLTIAGGLVAVVMREVDPVAGWSLAGAYAAAMVAVALYAGRATVVGRAKRGAHAPLPKGVRLPAPNQLAAPNQ